LALVVTPWQFALPVVDFARIPQEKREEQLQQLLEQEARKPFVLARGPLLRVLIARLDKEEHVVLLVLHHIIADGWSMHVIMRELAALYNAYVARQPSPLSPLPIQYADFAAWQRQWLQGEVLETQLAYWTKQLEGIEPLELPLDHPRPA